VSTEQRVVLVTGAASGIGAAVCRRIEGAGTRLVISARRNRDGLEAVAEAARRAGSAVVVALGDLTEPETPSRLVAAALENFGGLDQVVANAGFAQRGGVGDVDLDDLIHAQHGMPEAFFALTGAAIPHLRKSGWGRIVATSSFVAHVYAADGLFAATAAAKASVESLARTLAVELAPAGITVNAIAPGYTQKDASGHSALSEEAWRTAIGKIPIGRIGRPDDAAALIAFLLSRDAAYITGQTIHVDGGLTLA
jgi:NAD(P)-dependent dehydrogenase (short-subunit alcohol dehydrogenase family)